MALIVFGACGKEGKLEAAYVEGAAEHVASAFNLREWGLTQFEQVGGERVWINPTNVLYVKDAGEPGSFVMGAAG